VVMIQMVLMYLIQIFIICQSGENVKVAVSYLTINNNNTQEEISKSFSFLGESVGR